MHRAVLRILAQRVWADWDHFEGQPMTTTLIVLAHPSRLSFTGAWAEASAAACAAAGHEVLWSDLSAHQFEAVEGPRHFGQPEAGSFDPLKAHEAAVAAGRVPVDMVAEAEKIRQADQIIFHFPLGRFAPPAVLEGWFERAVGTGALAQGGGREGGGEGGGGEGGRVGRGGGGRGGRGGEGEGGGRAGDGGGRREAEREGERRAGERGREDAR